jgi:fucose 4-O-acetylase-like acetyltransferase
MEKNRLVEISYLRTLAIISIVFYHSFCPYMRWNFVESELNNYYASVFSIWFGARMPLFLFISGYLFSHLLHNKGKYTSYGKFILNKTKRLLIPYLIFATLLMVSHNNVSLPNLTKGYWHLWFILMLFWCFVITWPLKFVSKISIHALLFITFLAISFYLKTRIAFGIQYLVHYYIWFYCGYLVAIYRKMLSVIFQPKPLILICGLWFSLCFVRDYYGISTEHLKQAARFISNLSFILFAFGVFHLLTKKGILTEHPLISLMNKYSYGIYIAHIWIITLLFFKIDWITDIATNQPIIFPISLFIITIGSSFLATHLFLKTKIGTYLVG